MGSPEQGGHSCWPLALCPNRCLSQFQRRLAAVCVCEVRKAARPCDRGALGLGAHLLAVARLLLGHTASPVGPAWPLPCHVFSRSQPAGIRWLRLWRKTFSANCALDSTLGKK